MSARRMSSPHHGKIGYLLETIKSGSHSPNKMSYRKLPICCGDQFDPVVMVCKLDSRLLTDLSGIVESVSRALPAIRLSAKFVVDPGIHNIGMANDLAVFNQPLPDFPQALIRHVSRRRDQTVA